LKISREDVLRVAELAYLDLSETELETYRGRLTKFWNTSEAERTGHGEGGADGAGIDGCQTADATLREDLVVPSAVAEDVLKHAPDPEPPYFRVPKVIERA